MKTLLGIIVGLVLMSLISCDSRPQVVVTESQYNRLYKDSVPQLLMVNGENYPVFQGSDGHYYYTMYIATGAYTGATRAFHLGGCPTCKKQNK
jgi:hypothetical protein